MNAPRVTDTALAPEKIAPENSTPESNAPADVKSEGFLNDKLKQLEDMANTAEKAKTAKLTPEDKKALAGGLVSMIKPFVAYVTLPLSVIPAIGGAVVLASATTALPIIAGLGAIAASLWSAGKAVKLLASKDLDRKIEGALNKVGDALDPNAKPPVKDAKYFAKAALGLGLSAAKLGTSVALVSVFAATSGFAAFCVCALGVWLGVGGGIGTLLRTKTMISDVKQKIENSFLKDLPKEEASATTTAAPDLTASPVATVKAGSEFNASAVKPANNDNVPEEKPALTIKTPGL